MIKTNLIKREFSVNYQAGKWLATVLLAISLAQLILLWFRYHEARQQQAKYNNAAQKLSALKAETEKFATSVDLQDLAGKVAARNNWLIDRRNNPLNRLAKLQKDCPNNVRFLSFNADLTSGKIILTAPDLNSVSSWLNSRFSNRGNISVTGRENNLLMIQYVWSG
jgi:hypothetical protein